MINAPRGGRDGRDHAKTAHARIAVDGQRDRPAGLDIDPLPVSPDKLATRAATPVADREWRTLPEARALAGVTGYSIRN